MNLKLKLKIIEKYLSQWKFAAAVNEHETIVSKVVRKQRELPEKKKKIWANTLGCEMKDIF